MRKFHVFVGERYFKVQADYGEAEYGTDHLVFTYIDDADCLQESARFKLWDSYVEVLDGRDDGIDPEASKPSA